MAIEIPSALVEFILLGPMDDRRQLQDSPILGDVWVEFAKKPDQRLDLLITPEMTQSSGTVAASIEDRSIKFDQLLEQEYQNREIAYVQGIVAARLSFEELLCVVVPLTRWWNEKWIKDDKGEPTDRHELLAYAPEEAEQMVGTILALAADYFKKDTRSRRSETGAVREPKALDRYVALTGLILWACQEAKAGPDAVQASTEKIDQILEKVTAKAVLDELKKILATVNKLDEPSDKDATSSKAKLKIEPSVWQASLNRTAAPALAKSIQAVKADAVKTLFSVNASQITWAVVDSGIDGTHPAFQKKDGSGNRVKKSFDFSNFRKIVCLSNSQKGIREENLKILLQQNLKVLDEEKKEEAEKFRAEADSYLERLSIDARRGSGSIHWEWVEKFVEIKPETPPPSDHGTHVAGIIGASKEAAQKADPNKKNSDLADGMCPDINFYDFRVLGPLIKDTEFAIIAALQYIRYLNDRDNFYTIHGANLSLSIPHDVRNFACGRTPICNECERLIESGVVVVAAAGNHGYKSFETREGAYESYAAFSITDPGNADGVITVGATHRYWPHTYGVSFFSSRGPTGDGRLKPDLVAPGERIRAPIREKKWGDLDGTSMAAPHVSGAAAMLMARYSELIGQPRRIKRILCETATDLNRERSFQGHGMLDVLRAFQSI